jgi:hypothetical protein
MGNNDELDRSRALQFAWRTTVPALAEDPSAEEAAPLSDLLAASVEEGDEGEEAGSGACVDEAFRARAREACQLLADGIARVWATADLARQAEATAALIRHAAELGLSAGAMNNHPLESVRLLRLVTRHRERLPPDALDASRAASMWLDFGHPEIAELVIDLARAGDRSMQLSLMLAFGFGEERVPMPQPPSFGARLGAIIDEGPTWSARSVALRSVGYAEGTAFVPAIRRALRAPHAVVRWVALSTLERDFADAVREEDVLFLLEDAVLHPLPRGLESVEDVARALAYYPDLVEQAAARLRPSGGEAPLLRIINHQCVEGGSRWSLKASWAIGVLAAAYPDHAAPLIDLHLAAQSTGLRAAAARAAGRLPPDLARPRLLRAASDGAPTVSEPARAHWLDLFGTSCPVDELTPFRSLLDGPPSDRLLARVLGLRGPEEARRKLVSVLLTEAPDPEALVALAIAVSDLDAFKYVDMEGVPRGLAGWIDALVGGFGSRGVDALCALASRYANEILLGWFNAFNEAIARSAFPREELPKVLAIAVDYLASRAFKTNAWALYIVRRLGFPPDLYERLWAILWDPAERAGSHYLAGEALAAWADPARLEADVLGAMRAGLAARDYAKVMTAAAIGLKKPMPDAVALARAAFDEATTLTHLDEELAAALGRRARDLVELGALDAGWCYEALAQPETCRFTVAARLMPSDLRFGKAPPEAKRRAKRRLVCALAATSRGGVAAAEAACALLGAKAIGARNPRLRAAFSRAPLAARAALLGDFLLHEVPLGPVWPALEELLTTTDERALSILREKANRLPWSGHGKRLLELYPRVVDPHLCATFRAYLDALEGVHEYWQDRESDG